LAAKNAKDAKKMNETEIKSLSDRVRQTAYNIHVYLGHGHLEKVYENALIHRLHKAGVAAQQQHPLCVRDEDGKVLGEYYADLFIEDVVIVEIKTAKALAIEHEAQLIGYLRSAKLEHGLLINFGAPLFEIRKYALSKLRRK